MDLVNTVKVSHIRATVAYRKALADFDAALPELKAVADARDADMQAAFDREMEAWRDRTWRNSERRGAWSKYDAEYAKWKASGLFRAPKPLLPAVPRPDEYGYDYDHIPVCHMLGRHAEALDKLRDDLKRKVAMASVALCPFRVDANTAVFIAECEDGSYVARIKAGYVKKYKEGA